jgi:hypothetical protein
MEELASKLVSPQELFQKAIDLQCWEMALEVMEVLHGARSLQVTYLGCLYLSVLGVLCLVQTF